MPPAASQPVGPESLPASIIASLGRFEPPLEIDRFGASFGIGPARASGILNFRFCFEEVPFHARTERRASRAVLSLTGDLGVLPFTIENATRRRRLRKVLAAARHASGLTWAIGADHCIRVSGEIDLGEKLTPTAVIAGATTLLLRSRPYLELIIAVASES